MTDATMATNQTPGTVRLHRVLRAPAERVYRAFVDRAALEYWLPPFGFIGKIHTEAAVTNAGDSYHMSFINFSSGASDAFTMMYLELTPGRRVRHVDRFDDAHLPGEISVTVDFTSVWCGTELHILQEGIPPVIPVPQCYLGWQESLQKLAQLVEAEISDES